MRNFKTDLVIGQTGEIKVAEIFKAKGYTVEFNTAKTVKELKGWDLSITKDEITYKVEVKTDLMCQKTNNVAIEWKCVEHSSSDFFVYVVEGKGIWYTSIKNIRYMMSDSIIGRNLWGGDRGATQLKLVSVIDFLKVSKELKVE